MKGVLLNAVEEAVSAEWGEQMWDELLTACGLDGAYTALGNYPDAELVALARAAAERLDCSVDDVQRTLGRLTFKPLMTRYRRFPEAPTSLRELPPSPSLPSSPLPLPPLGAPSSAPDPRPPPPARASPPSLPLPVASKAVVPEPSSKGQCATKPSGWAEAIPPATSRSARSRVEKPAKR